MLLTGAHRLSWVLHYTEALSAVLERRHTILEIVIHNRLPVSTVQNLKYILPTHLHD